MTILEAENQYDKEVKYYTEQYQIRLKSHIMIWLMISTILIMLGIILLAIGLCTPPEIDSFGNEWDTTATLEKTFGIASLWVGAVFFIIIIPMLSKAKAKGPASFLPQIKNLYLNYLRCEDMYKDDKEFYRQKLEEIRHMELINAVNRASAAASAAILFSVIKK